MVKMKEGRKLQVRNYILMYFKSTSLCGKSIISSKKMTQDEKRNRQPLLERGVSSYFGLSSNFRRPLGFYFVHFPPNSEPFPQISSFRHYQKCQKKRKNIVPSLFLKYGKSSKKIKKKKKFEIDG